MVPVLDKHKKPLMPCTEKRVRLLLRRGRAVVHRRVPFVIRLKDRTQEASTLQPVALKLDPGSRVTGLAVVREEETAEGTVHHALHLAELEHRGQVVHQRMRRRAQARRRRRATRRHRKPRFAHRTRPAGWLPPSLRSRVDNTLSWARRYARWVPLTHVDVERARFDMQLLRDPTISGVKYQQGTLAGYEVRSYLLEHWQHRCAYCGQRGVPLEVEHITPRSRGGSERLDNLCLACPPCNAAKGMQTAAEFGFPQLQAQVQTPLRDAAAVNSTCSALCARLEAAGFALRTWTGGRTRWNRSRFEVPKTHALDALCVGALAGVTGTDLPVLDISARGRGMRWRTRLTRFGFPRGYCLRAKRVTGLATGDLVRAVVPSGKHRGVQVGRVAIRARGFVRVGPADGIAARHCAVLQRADGYAYVCKRGCAARAAHPIPSRPNGRGLLGKSDDVSGDG
jgi:5-methylcytosine-specific restriction endonuclease McrA